MFKRVLMILIMFAGLTSVSAQVYDTDADADVVYETQSHVDEFFTVEVPEGWTFEGGYVDLFGVPLPIFVMTAPDEISVIQYGLLDPRFYIEPNDLYEEEALIPWGSIEAVVRPYVPAEEFYVEYIEENLITFGDCTEAPEVTVEPVESASVLPEDVTGEFEALSIVYRCVTEERVHIADIYFEMARVDVADVGSVWLVNQYLAYIAPEEDQPLVYAITEHVANSVTINEEFLEVYVPTDPVTDAFAEATELSGLLAGIYGSR